MFLSLRFLKIWNLVSHKLHILKVMFTTNYASKIKKEQDKYQEDIPSIPPSEIKWWNFGHVFSFVHFLRKPLWALVRKILFSTGANILSDLLEVLVGMKLCITLMKFNFS